jgi:hypothetical protein
MAARGELDEVSGHLPLDHTMFVTAVRQAEGHLRGGNLVQFWAKVTFAAELLGQASQRLRELSDRAERHYREMYKFMNGGGQIEDYPVFNIDLGDVGSVVDLRADVVWVERVVSQAGLSQAFAPYCAQWPSAKAHFHMLDSRVHTLLLEVETDYERVLDYLAPQSPMSGRFLAMKSQVQAIRDRAFPR